MKSLTVVRPSQAGGNRIHGIQGCLVKTVSSYTASFNIKGDRDMSTNRTTKSVGSVFGKLYTKRRSEKSYFGYHPLVLKSGIQKYARRAKVQKGLWCLIEMDLFSLLEWNGPALNAYLRKYPERTRVLTKRGAQAIRTNMINRLIANMSEEVSISAWWMPLKIFELYQQWHENRYDVSSRKSLVDMYYYLTSQKMIRLISDLKSVFLIPPLYLPDEKRGDLIKIHNNIKNLCPEIFSAQSSVGRAKWGINMGGYSTKVQRCARGIIYNLEEGSDHVFYWIKKLCDFERDQWVPKTEKDKFKYKYKYFNIVWKILHRFIDRNSEYEFVREIISALHFFHKKMDHDEKPIYLYHAVLLMVRRDEIDWSSIAPVIDTPIADVEILYKDHLADGKMPVDDYILDLHTHGGKRSGDCLENFALEGAYIKNENIDFLRPEYREIYIKLKQELDLYHSRGGQI
jgi:hypothetical protein